MFVVDVNASHFFSFLGIGTKATINKIKVQKWWYLKEKRLNKSNCMKVNDTQKLIFNKKKIKQKTSKN